MRRAKNPYTSLLVLFIATLAMFIVAIGITIAWSTLSATSFPSVLDLSVAWFPTPR